MMTSYQAEGEISLSLKHEDFFLFNGFIITLCILIYSSCFDSLHSDPVLQPLNQSIKTVLSTLRTLLFINETDDITISIQTSPLKIVACYSLYLVQIHKRVKKSDVVHYTKQKQLTEGLITMAVATQWHNSRKLSSGTTCFILVVT